MNPTDTLEIVNAVLAFFHENGSPPSEISKIEKSVRPLSEYKVTLFGMNQELLIAYVGPDDYDELEVQEFEGEIQ